MSNSPLVNYTKISPNKNSPRNHKIDTISIHMVVGQCTVESLGDLFAKSSRQASSNYGVGKDGKIGMYVEEKDRSWCSSSPENDHRAITIEVASDTVPPYAITDAAYKGLINLLVDICKRNDIKELKWKADKSLIGQVDKQNMTVHKWFTATSCPGEYLYNLHGQIAKEVNAHLGVKVEPSAKPTTPKKSVEELAKEVINGDWGVGTARKEALTNAGYDYSAVQKRVNELCASSTKPATPKKSVDELAKEVIYGKWGVGAARKEALTEAGYDYSVVQNRVNELCAASTKPATPKKSVDELAKEVIYGKWGVGTARKEALTKAGYDYSAVQKRVNEMLAK